MVKAQISVIMGFEQLQEVERRTIDFHCFICQFWYNDIIIITNHVGLKNLHLGSTLLGIALSSMVYTFETIFGQITIHKKNGSCR